MNQQADIPGHISGQVPNQAGSQLPGQTQLNGNGNVNALPSQMPSLGGSAINTEFLRARALIRDRIYEMLLQRHAQPVSEMQKRRIKDLSKRLEEGLLKDSLSKEDYMNLDTLESRLTNFLRQVAMHNHNKQNPQLVSSSPMGTMTPTPGMSHGSNSSMAVASSIDASRISSSGCNRIVSTSFNGVNMLPAGGMLGSSKDHKDEHVPGKISGGVPNQAGSEFPGQTQLNGNVLPTQMPSLGGSTINMDPEELRRARSFIQERIFVILMQRHQQPTNEMQRRRIKDLSKRLQEGMLKASLTMEEYMNLGTLESRLSNFLQRATMLASSKAHKAVSTKKVLQTKTPKDIPATTFPTGDHVEPPPKQTLIKQVIVALPSRTPVLTESNQLKDEAVDVSQNVIAVDVENVQTPVKK